MGGNRISNDYSYSSPQFGSRFSVKFGNPEFAVSTPLSPALASTLVEWNSLLVEVTQKFISLVSELFMCFFP